MTAQPQKLSAIMKDMSEQLLRNPAVAPSSDAAHMALMFANIAWNETVGLVRSTGYTCACSNVPGVTTQASDSFELPRLIVPDLDGASFDVWLSDVSTRWA